MAQALFVSSSQSELIQIGEGVNGFKSTTMLQVEVMPGWTGSLGLRKKVNTAQLFTTSSYTKELNGSSDNAAITGSGLFSLNSTGCALAVSHTMTVSGSVVISYSSVNG
jgi:hypothetical protein